MSTRGVRVLGIDPGLERTGYACVELGRDGWSTRLVEAGVIRLKRGSDLSSRLLHLSRDMDEAIGELAPQLVAVETVFTHPKNLRTAILMAHARGAVLLAAARAGLSLIELSPATVKKAMTGKGNATKRQMQLAVVAEFALAALPEPHDVADAIAIALAGGRRAG